MECESGNKPELSDYILSVLADPESAASVYAEVRGRAKLAVSVRVEENRELDSVFELSISAPDVSLQAAYAVYTNQLTRVLGEVVRLTQYSKTRFVVRVTLVEASPRGEALCHIVNILSLTLMLSRIQMKYFPVAAVCYVDDANRIYSESEAAEAKSGLTAVYLAKKLSGDDEVVSFSVSGGRLHDEDIDRVLSYAVGAANIVGRKLLEFAHAHATSN